MIDLRQIPPRLFGVALESNLRQLGPDYKLNAHFVEAARIRLEADCAWMVPDSGEITTPDRPDRPEAEIQAPIVVRGDASLFDPAAARAPSSRALRSAQEFPLLPCRAP